MAKKPDQIAKQIVTTKTSDVFVEPKERSTSGYDAAKFAGVPPAK